MKGEPALRIESGIWAGITLPSIPRTRRRKSHPERTKGGESLKHSQRLNQSIPTPFLYGIKWSDNPLYHSRKNQRKQSEIDEHRFSARQLNANIDSAEYEKILESQR